MSSYFAATSSLTMTEIHDAFPADDNDSNDPISEKKLKQLDGEYSTKKTILGFDFDGIEKTIWLEKAKQAHPPPNGPPWMDSL